MNEVAEELKYTKTHEWIKIEEDKVRIGITDHAQGELTDIVYVEMPEKGTEIKKGDVLGTVESVKATNDVFSPVSGMIAEVNAKLEDTPELMNSEPYGNGWMVLLKLADKSELAELLTAEDYGKILGK
jgi:glycine cleavage system H protein